jgi:hypothetical protein
LPPFANCIVVGHHHIVALKTRLPGMPPTLETTAMQMTPHLSARSQARIVLALSAGIVFFPGAAFALDGNAFGERLKSVYGAQAGGGGISYQAAEVAGDSVTLKGVTLDVDPATKLPVGDVMFEGVAESAGVWTAAKATIADINTTVETASYVMKGFVIEGMKIPAADATGATPFILYDRAAIAEASFSIGGKPAAGMTGYEVLVNAPAPETRMDFTSVAQSLYVNIADISTDPASAEAAKALGVERLDGKLTMNGSWVAEKGSLAVTEFSYAVPSTGKIDLTFAFDGYTPEFIKTLGEVSNATASAGNDEQAQAAQGLAMLGLIQQLAYVSTKIRYDDDGFTNRALDFAAARQGATRETLVPQLKGMLPFALGQLQNPELAASVSAAVSAFLDNPKNITINATPAAPVPGAMLMATGAGNPLELVKTLNVQVTANE